MILGRWLLLLAGLCGARRIPQCAVIASSATMLELEFPDGRGGTLPGASRHFFCAFPRRLLHTRRIVSFFGGPVDAGGAAIDAPPLHVHHLHVIDGDDDPVDFHVFATHGDFTGGGDPPWNTSLAPGYCLAFDGMPDATNAYRDPKGAYVVSAMVDDARVGGRALAFAMRLRWSFTEACRTVSQIWVHSPREAMPWGTYATPRDASVTWWSARWPLDGALVGAHYHAHQRAFRRAFVVDGALADVVGKTACAALELSERDGYAVLGGDRRGLEAALASSDRRLCAIEGRAETVGNKTFGRRSAVACRPAVARKGRRFTVVAFHGGAAGDVHDILWLQVDANADRSVSFPLAAADVNACRHGPPSKADVGDAAFWKRRADGLLATALGMA